MSRAWDFAGAAATLGLPLWAAGLAAHPRTRGDLAERLGLAIPPLPPGSLWVHAASVGEVGAAEALLAALGGPALLTADTDTGVAAARAVCTRVSGVWAAARPVDHPWTLAPVWATVRPRALIFVENTWWPQLAERARLAGVPTLRVGVSLRRRFDLRLWRLASAHFTQIGEDAARLRAMGFQAEWIGDLKGDKPLPARLVSWNRPYLVGASTRPGDERALLAAIPNGFGLLLAPRHLDRLPEVEALLAAQPRPWGRRSEVLRVVPDSWGILLLDRMGELGAWMPGARAAVIGGTWDPRVGGHSPAEAARAGIPVVAGPHRGANAAAWEAWPPLEAPDYARLPAAIAAAIASPPRAPWRSGAAPRAAASLAPWLGGPPAPEAAPRPWAAPAVPLYAAVAEISTRVRGIRPYRPSIPVISIGSLNARGPGKTSTVRWWVRALLARGHRPAVALRGYGRTARGLSLSWEGANAELLGDEGILHARAGALVAACARRDQAAAALQAAGATVILLDDGLLARELSRDLELGVVDARYPLARGPIPAGEGRSPQRLARKIDGWIAHFGRFVADVPVVEARRIPGPWWRGASPTLPPEGPVAVVLGLAQPAEFLAGLEMPAARVRILKDHAAIPKDILAWAGDLPLVCSAKDHARMPDSLAAQVYWRDLHLDLRGVPPAWLLEF